MKVSVEDVFGGKKKPQHRRQVWAVYPDGREVRLVKRNGLGYPSPIGGQYNGTLRLTKIEHEEAGATIEYRNVPI